ncbi:LacI family transcriptional regulator, partial [Escherichia coli]|nr:LacI family transcriptional regulator [Escherichia coli]
ELLEGLNPRLATMDACRREIGAKAAEIIARCVEDGTTNAGERIELTPRLEIGQTLKRG